MPQADPNSSFDVAVRHLFRHLNDAAALRKNPITSCFFKSDHRLARTGRDGERGLRAIRQAIAWATERLLTGDTPIATGERQKRQLAIVKKWVLEGSEPAVLCAEFGISMRQLYRERTEICTAIARHIASQQKPRSPVRITDLRQFRLRRAHALAEAGSYEQARHIYDETARSCGYPDDVAQVLCRKATIELQQNDFLAAQRTLADAQNAARSVSSAAEAGLLEAKIAWASGAFSSAHAILERTHATLRESHAADDDRTKRVLFDVLLERANCALDVGPFGAARRYQAELDTLSLTLTRLAPEREIDLAYLRLQLPACETKPGSSFSILEEQRALHRAAELAVACGSLKRTIALECESFLMGHAAHADGARDLVAPVRRLLDMSEELGNRRTLAVVPIELAGMVAFTRAWQEVPAIIAPAEPHVVPGSVDWARLHVIKSFYYLASQQPEKAALCAKRAYDVGRAMGSERVMANGLRSLGAAAYALHNEGEAMEYLDTALSFSERSSPPLVRLLMYQLAGIITGQPYYKRAAIQLRRSIGTV